MYGAWFICMEVCSYSALPERMKLKTFRLIYSHVTDCTYSASLFITVLHLLPFSIAIFTLTAFPILLIACLPLLLRPRCTRLSALSHLCFVHLSHTKVTKYSFRCLVNSGIPCLLLYFLFPVTWTLSRRRLRNTSSKFG